MKMLDMKRHIIEQELNKGNIVIQVMKYHKVVTQYDPGTKASSMFMTFDPNHANPQADPDLLMALIQQQFDNDDCDDSVMISIVSQFIHLCQPTDKAPAYLIMWDSQRSMAQPILTEDLPEFLDSVDFCDKSTIH